MIFDRIQNRRLYARLGSSIGEALEYLATTDFSDMPNGKHMIDGDRLFIVVQRYRPKPLSEIIWEAHRDYIDVQYVVSGAGPHGLCAAQRRPDGAGGLRSPARHNPLQRARGLVLPASRPRRQFLGLCAARRSCPALAIESSKTASEVLKVVAKCHV